MCECAPMRSIRVRSRISAFTFTSAPAMSAARPAFSGARAGSGGCPARPRGLAVRLCWLKTDYTRLFSTL